MPQGKGTYGSKVGRPSKKPEMRSAKMPSIIDHIMGSSTGRMTDRGVVKETSAAERSINRSQLIRFLKAPTKFRGGPASRIKYKGK